MDDFDKLLYSVGGNPYANHESQNNDGDDDASSSGGGLLSGLIERLKETVTPTVIAPDYKPRPLSDSVYADTPGTTVADGNFGQQEDESARQQRMDESAQYMIENYPRAYGTMLAFDNGVANSVGSIQEGLGLGDDAMKQATAAVESQKPIWDTWDAKYGDNYFSNPKGLASAIGSAAGSTLPILALGELMPGAVVARGVKLGQAGLTRLGLGGLAQKGAVKGLLEEAVRSPIPNAADSLMEYGGVVHDLKQNGYSDEAARNQARSILAKNMLLDTATIPLELSLMKGLRGTNGKLFNSHLRDSLGTRLAKGTGRAGLLATGNGLVEGLQEGAQNALEDQTKGERDGGWWNPLTWTEDDWKAARDGFAGGAFLGLPGGFVQGFHPERPTITDEMGGRSPEDIAVNSTWTAGQEQTEPAGYFYRGETTETGVKTPEDIVGGVASRTANQNSVSGPALFGTASDGTETGIKSPEDIIAGVQNRAGVSADTDNTGRVPVFNNSGGEGTVTGISSPEEIIANVQQRQAQTKMIEDQKAVISQYLDDNTIEQMGGEDNYNWLMNVVRSGTPDDVQKAYQTVVSSTAATKRQEAEAHQRTAPVYTQGHSSEMTTPRSENPNVNAVLQAAHDQNFDAGLALAVAAVESGGGDVNEIHMAGHDGMFQIEPETAQNYGVADKYPDWQTDPYQNAMAGIEVLKAKIDEKDGDTWAGVAHYNGGGDPDYLPKVQAAYDHTSNMADSVTTGGASYDGFRLTLPDSDEFTDQSGNVDGLTEDTHMKLRVLDNLCYQKFGQHLIVSSSYREGDPNNHGAGVAFDVSGGIVDDPDARQWLEQAGPAVGLFVIPEYQGEAGAEFAHGDNVHFSNVEPGIYGQTRDAEGHWSEEHAAPSIQSILNGSGSATSAVKGKSSLSQWGSNGFTDALHHWEDAVIPDVAGQMRENTPEDTGLFDGIFTIDDKGQEHFKDTPENREIIQKQYHQQVQDAAMEAMAKDLLRTPAVQQSAVANPLSHAVEHGDTTAMMKLARQWFDVKTPNLDRERTQSYIAQPTARPIGGMEVETNRSTRQNQADSPETVPHQDVDTLSGQSQETRAGIQGIVRPATQGEIPVTATPAVVTEQVSRPMAPSRPATLPDDARISTIGLSQADTVQNPISAWGNQNPEGVFDKTILQGRPVIRQQEVLEDDQNIGDVKHLQDMLFHKGEAVFNVDDFEAEKNKRSSSYTIQDYAKEWLARKTPNVKRDTAAYQALEKEITQQMGNAYALTQKETKKAALKDDVKTIKKSLLNLATKVWQNPRAQGKVTFYPSQKLKDKVKELFGHDIDTVFITADDIRHIKSGHSEHEENRGQINLSEQDIPDIYDVVNDFDNATKLQSDAKGNQKIMFVKDVNGKMISLLIERGKHKAQVKTAYKKQVQMSDVTSPEPNVLNDSVPASTSIISQKAEKGNKPDELRNQLSNGGKQAYDYAFDKLSQGHEKVAQSAKESAFIYARMAERWYEIMHEYGNKTYSPEDYTKSHPIVMGQQSGNAQLERAFEQRAWHGSGVDFDNFDLGKIGSGTGASMHGWGIYAAKSKRTAQKYKKEMKDRGLPPVLYEIDVPANKELLDEDKRYKDQMKGVQTKILQAVQSLSMEQKQAFWTKWLRQAMGSTKDEIQAETALRKVELNIKHCHDASLGWEGLPAFRKRIALNSLKKQGYTDEQINDTSYMESESKRWEKELPEAKQQAKESKEAGDKKRNQLIEAAMENPEVTLEKGIGTGKEIYNYLTDALSDGKDIEKTSKYLNEQGIHGITYDDAYDGRCYVVFDDKAIQIINKYNQDVHNAKAAYDASTGAIRLFDIADQSSFIHESAHMFLSDMERLARKKGAPAGLVSDLQTVKDWAGYKPGQMNGYKGTALEKEFQEYAEAIREAKKTGNAVAIKAAEERWMHERFARGFERYLADGEAPTPSLKHVFEKFMDWMVGIYLDLKNLGKKPPKEIQAVMARMITLKASTKYSVRKKDAQLIRSREDLKAEIKEAFPNAKKIMDDGDRITFTMPNGSHIVVDLKNEIVLTDEELAQAKKEHHIDDNGNVVVEGYAEVRGKDAYMALAQGSRENTGFHEAYHLAEGAVLTDREKAAIKKAIPDAEKRADKYAEWVEARKHGRGTAWGKLFQKIKDFAAKIKSIFTRAETVHDVFRQIESGKVWERGVSKQKAERFSQPLYKLKHIVGSFTDKEKLNKFVNTVLTHGQKSLVMHLGIVNADEAKAIKKFTGYDVNGYEHVWRGNDVQHVQKRHGVNTETANNQIGLSLDEMVDALKVISAPDKIERGSINKDGPSIRYIKAENGGQLTIVEVVKNKRKTLDIKTMWKKRAEKLHGDYALQDTSETALDATPSTTENVAHNTDNVNGEKHYSIRKPKDAADEAQEKAEQAAEDTAVTMKDILAAARKILPIYTRSKIHYNSRAAYRYDEHGRAGFVPSNYTIGDIGASIALHLDHVAQLKGANVELTNDVLDELEIEKRAAKKYKQEAPKAMTPAEARREGVKEFGRIYFQDPARAKEKYPKYYDIFEKTLDGMSEEKAAVEKILELEAQRAAQNPLLLATAGISLADDRKKPQTVKERLNTAWARFYRTMVDETDPLRQITKCIEMELGKKLADEKDPHKRAVMCNSVAEGRASMLLFADNKAANIAYLNKIYKGAIRDKVTFEDVLNTLRKVRTEDIKKAAAKDVETYFGMYLVAQRTEEIVKTHKNYVRPEGYSHENCLRIIAEAPEAIRKAAQLYWKYNRNLVNIMEAEGLISEKQAAGLRKYEKYCPMYRDMSENRTFDDELPTITAGRGFINQSSGIKKLKGGSILAVINPIDSMVSMTTALIARCERNDVAKVMVQSAEDHPGLGRIIVKDPSLSRADASKCAFTVMIAGKKTVYRTTPELYKALQEMSTNSAAFLTNVFGKFTDALRFGATNTPSFMVRNFIRDTLSASVNARYGKFVPIVDSIRGMKALKGDADFRAKFYGQGVPMDTYIRRDIRGAKQYKDKVQKSLKRYPLGIQQLMALSRSLVYKYNGVGEALEQGTRAGAMLNALKAGASDFEAGQEARDVTVNFSRHGSFGKKVNRYVPFFNASIQGTDKVIRTFLENPKRASLATCLYIILPTIILWAINYDDDWYKELDDNTKYTNWALHIPGTDYHWLIPKPQEVGIGFGSGVEAVLNQMLNEDPHAMKAWARQFAEAVTPGIILTALRPVLEWRYNYSEWTGRKLVPERLSKLPPEQQYTTATSELAKLMSQFAGKYVGLSPIAIDNFFSGWFGSLGRMSANALNKPIDAIRGSSRPPEPARYWYESPFIGSFARQDGQNSVYVERFYQLAEDMEMDYKRSDSYAKNKGKKGAPIPASLKAAQTCMKTMTKINKDIRSIKDDPKMDPETKRKRIDAAYTKMRTYAKKFVTQYDK